MHTQFEQAQGQSNVRRFKTGDLFSLNNYSREDQNREYLIVSVSHSIQSDSFDSRGSGSSSMLYNNHFSCIESQTPFRPARITPKPIVQGTQTAIVVGPSGEEIYTNEHAQVKLQFHWDRYGTFDENSSCWIRVSQLWAGKNWGGIHIPRMGQEVIVDFLEGDPDCPIVVGRVYNGEQIPPYGLPTNKTQSGIKSRSSKGGSPANFNEIRMEDKKGKEQVYIHAEKNQDNIVENDETTFVGHDRTEIIGNDETITIKGDRTEIVGAGKEGGDEKITIKGDRTELVEHDEKITINGDRVETVGAGEGGDEKVTITGNKSEFVGTGGKGDRIRFVKNNETIDVGNKLSITAGDEISLSVGKSLLVMKKDGTITLSGTDISITATKKTEMGVGSQNTTHDTKQIESTGAQITSAAIGTHNITGALIKIN